MLSPASSMEPTTPSWRMGLYTVIAPFTFFTSFSLVFSTFPSWSSFFLLHDKHFQVIHYGKANLKTGHGLSVSSIAIEFFNFFWGEGSGGQKLVSSDTTERLHFHFSLSCIGGGNGNPLHYSCLENPRDGGAWWAAIYGVTQSRTWLKWLSSSSRLNISSMRIKDCLSYFFIPLTMLRTVFQQTRLLMKIFD